jgi:hypothetical protein
MYRFNQLDEDNKRLVIRGDIKQWNQLLAEAAHDAGGCLMSNRTGNVVSFKRGKNGR